MGYYRRRRRRTRLVALFLMILLLAAVLVSCVAGADSMFLPRLFGTDVNMYRSEDVLAVHPTDGELALSLSESISWLSTGSVELEEFHSASKAVKLYRDEILNSLMLQNYSAYVGNTALSGSVREHYPYLSATVMIPQADFENAVTRYLGANSVQNTDGDLFSYLSKSDCYTTPSSGSPAKVAMTALSLEETNRTYRLGFSLTDSSGSAASYQALFVKRSDGTAYLKALERI